MKLLLDANLSGSLCARLWVDFPGSEHVAVIGLGKADDQSIWSYTKANGIVIVTKDSDFHHLSFVQGAPPKVVWLRLGNCTTGMVEAALLNSLRAIFDLAADPDAALLSIDGP